MGVWRRVALRVAFDLFPLVTRWFLGGVLVCGRIFCVLSWCFSLCGLQLWLFQGYVYLGTRITQASSSPLPHTHYVTVLLFLTLRFFAEFLRLQSNDLEFQLMFLKL